MKNTLQTLIFRAKEEKEERSRKGYDNGKKKK